MLEWFKQYPALGSPSYHCNNEGGDLIRGKINCIYLVGYVLRCVKQWEKLLKSLIANFSLNWKPILYKLTRLGLCFTSNQEYYQAILVVAGKHQQPSSTIWACQRCEAIWNWDVAGSLENFETSQTVLLLFLPHSFFSGPSTTKPSIYKIGSRIITLNNWTWWCSQFFSLNKTSIECWKLFKETLCKR